MEVKKKLVTTVEKLFQVILLHMTLLHMTNLYWLYFPQQCCIQH